MMKKVTAVACLLVSGLAACAVGEYSSTPPEDAQAPLVGGTDDTGDPAVVALFAHKPGETSGFLCTSTLIGPRVLLTAAHCVSPAEVGDGVVFEAIFANVLKGSPASARHAVSEVRYDPLFNPNLLTNGHDIGVAILQDPVTDIQPLPFIRTPLTPAVAGKTIRLVGYGLNNGFDTQGASAGTKRTLTASLNSVDNVTISVGTFGSTSCNGDSGGPGLVNIGGRETVIGVTSYGIAYCLSAGFYTRVDLYTSFVDKALADTAGDGGGGGGCTSDCDQRECGIDNCGNECPQSCARDEVCTPMGTCEPGNSGGGCPDETEGNETIDQANPLCPGDSISGKIGTPNDVDYFKFDVVANQYYTIIVDNVKAKYQVAIFKKSTSGSILTVGTAVQAGPMLVFTRRTTTGGTYFVKVSATDPSVDTSNVYDLFVVKE